MLTRTILLALALLVVPKWALAQESAETLAVGDSVRFSLELDAELSTWTGVVREVRNPRECVFVLLRSYDSDMFSLGVEFTDTFELERLQPAPSVFTASALRSQGIKCVEAHIREDSIYLNPKPDADSKEGA